VVAAMSDNPRAFFTRRQVLRLGTVGLGSLASLALLEACSAPAPAVQPTAAPAAPKPTTAPAAAQPTNAPAAAKPTTAPAAAPTTAAAPKPTTAPAAAAGELIYADLIGGLPKGGRADVSFPGSVPSTLDVNAVATAATQKAADPAHDFLVRYNTKGTVRESLAESFQLVNPQTHKYVLRSGLTFHNGKPVTAQDVKAAFDWVLDTNNASALRGRYVAIEAEAADERTIIFHLKAPDAAFRGNLTRLAVTDADVAQATNPVGCGPYVFQKWEKDSYVDYIRNEKYWFSGLPRLDTLRISHFPDSVSGSQAFLAGQKDFIEDVPIGQLDEYRGRASAGDIAPLLFKPASIYYLQMNHSRKPFDDQRVRLALALSIDREKVIQTALGGTGEPMWQIGVLKDNPYYFKDLEYPRDLARARQLLADAGLADGFSFKLMTHNTGAFADVAQVAQANWAEIGIKAEVTPVDLATVVGEAVNKSNFDMLGSADGLDPDPGVQVDANLATTGSSNWRKYSNKTFDDLLARGRQEYDVAARQKIYREAFELAFKTDIAIIPVATRVVIDAHRKYLNGDVWTESANGRYHYPLLARSA
jgi:ABC-type transport system substrate-binding protein